MLRGNDNLYTIKRNVPGALKQFVLKLNREKKTLDLYERINEEKLRKYYTLREDFDLSEYSVFEKKQAFSCLCGREESPTPFGMFQIQKVSSDEYVSGYHAKYDKVKFFGYLVIFEDYFIHSDMYLEDVEESDMREGKAESISKDDKGTAGCIRVAQDVVDWLVEHVEEGSIVYL